ncbi:MAG: hypothetical protein IPK16_13165 [Anaerolineales bacterium]|nr:hypothetical protein [Anaerolineales bacterium]
MKQLRPSCLSALPSIRRAIWAPAAGAITALVLMLPTIAYGQDTTPATVDATTPLCRLGVNAASDPIEKFDIAQLRTGFYIDYSADASPVHPNGAEYMPIIGLEQIQRGKDDYAYHPNGAALDAAIAANLGATWIIGNEPDRRYYQNDMEPAAYARAYHDLYRLLKSKDPNATVLAGAIVQPTPLRLQYLDLVLRAYVAKYREPMPVDGWAIHNFILNERSCEYYLDPAHRPPDYDGPEPYNGAYVCWGRTFPPASAPQMDW